jgi:serine/threonine protein kinase
VTSSDHTDSLVGRVVAGRYEVLRKLNQGGVGAVYLAMQRPLDRPVALKVLLKKHADDPTAIRRFEKEAAAVARLAHAHIVTLYDFGSTDAGDLYIAMELLRGQSVRELLDAAGYIPWERALHIMIGVTRALVAAHAQKIAHRDLKPENIMLVESNGDLDFAKVLDFGLARSITATEGPQITRHDVIPGTPAYMSPERANGISDDPRSDLYALGAMWFELLVGEPPFPGETSIKVILRHVHEAPRRPSQANPHNPVPPFVDELVLRLLEKAPEGRPASAKALLDELDAIERPAGWHVGRAADVARRGAHDTDLAAFSAAASTLVDTDDITFAVEAGEPMPLLRRKPATPPRPPQQGTGEAPLLLTQKKSSSLPPMSSSMSSTQPLSVTAPPASSSPQTPLLTPSPAKKAYNTEDFLRSPNEERGQMPSPSPSSGYVILAPPAAPPRIDSVAQVAGWLSTAKTTREVGELCAAFLSTRFDRVLIMDLRQPLPVTMAQVHMGGRSGLSLPAVVHALQGSRAVAELAGRREAYYGPAVTDPDWLSWFGALGGPVPGAMFVGGLGREGRAAFLFYADHKDATLRPMVKDTVILLREAAAALSALG